MPDAPETTCNLFVILARKAPVGAVFRSAPDDRVQVIKWNTNDDTFEEGQWFNGKIHARRGDISADGTKLLYFAVQPLDAVYDSAFTNAWTAVSRLPWLTPFVLWPKGDSMAGGGLFHDDNHVWLNHRPERAKAHPEHQPPEGLFVNPNKWAQGEDYPVYANRLERDGWHYTQHGDFRLRDGVWVSEKEERCTKPDPTRRFQLEMVLAGFDPKAGGAALRFRFSLTDLVTGKTARVDADNWADFDRNGRLVYVKGGRLFAAQPAAGAEFDVHQLADFSANKFEDIQAPAEALKW